MQRIGQCSVCWVHRVHQFQVMKFNAQLISIAVEERVRDEWRLAIAVKTCQMNWSSYLRSLPSPQSNNTRLTARKSLFIFFNFSHASTHTPHINLTWMSHSLSLLLSIVAHRAVARKIEMLLTILCELFLFWSVSRAFTFFLFCLCISNIPTHSAAHLFLISCNNSPNANERSCYAVVSCGRRRICCSAMANSTLFKPEEEFEFETIRHSD